MRFFYILILFFILTAGAFFSFQIIGNVHAQCLPNDRNQGLVSGTSLSGSFGNPTGQCVIDAKSAYAQFKVPGYSELKSVFFTQNRNMTQYSLPNAALPCPGGTTSGTVYLRNLQNISGFANTPAVVNVACSMTRIDDTGGNGPLTTSSRIVVVFAENNVSIDSNLNWTGDSYGLVIIAKGDIYINPAITQINALLVAEGNIFTSASAAPNFTTVSAAPQIRVNGSVIALSKGANRIYFNRSLTNNDLPAEIVNYQPKYLVLLRGLLTQSFTIQREIGPDEIPSASIFPSPTSIPSPAPTNNPGSTQGNPFKVFSIYNLVNQLLI